MRNNIWFPFDRERNHSSKMLFCFHHAGGAASFYRDWIRWSDKIQVIPVELPGKATRMGELYAENMLQTSEEIARQIVNESECADIWLYGHSMGAVLAFSVACVLEKKYGKHINKLIVSGRHAPQDHVEDIYHSTMGDEALMTELRRLGGTPTELLENPDIAKFILPPIKADYKLNESYHYEGDKLHCSISAYAGDQDLDAPVTLMKNWKKVTDGQFEIFEEKGSHFFPTELGQSYWKKIEDEILRMSERLYMAV